jgi:hypothetical protein
MKKATALVSIAIAVTASLAGCAAVNGDSDTIDWTRVPARTLTLFYPGQSAYQWVRGPDHPGSSMVVQGTPCATCHNGQEEKLGAKLVGANPLEPTPVSGKNGFVKLGLQVAYDNKNAYFRFQWRTKNNFPGEAYPWYRFDGKEWKAYGQPRLNAAARKGEQPAIYEDRLTMMIDDGSVPNFGNQGCWLTCHRGERDMPQQATAAEVTANPLYKAIKRNDVRKYLPSTRTDEQASWDKGKSVEEIEKIKAAGGFLDLISGVRTAPIGRHGRRRLRTRMAQLRRGSESVFVQPGCENQTAEIHVRREKSRPACDDRRRDAQAPDRAGARGGRTLRSQRGMEGRRSPSPVHPQPGWRDRLGRGQQGRQGGMEGRHVDPRLGPAPQPRQSGRQER